MHAKDLAIFDEMPVNFFIKDESGRYIWANKATYTMARCGSRDEMIGKTDLELIWGQAEGTKTFMKNDHDVLETGKPFKGEENTKLASGETLSVEVIKFVSDLDGKKCLVGIAITNGD